MKAILLITLISINSAALAANRLTLYFVPSPKGLDWTTPQSLAKTTLKNELAISPAGQKHSIGHVYEEIECGTYHRFIGMTSTGSKQERNAIFKQKVGLGVILIKYIGRFNTNEEAITDLNKMERKGRSNFMSFNVSDTTCKRLMDYVDEYQNRKLDQIYAGLNYDALDGEGSGCSSFGASFLTVAGLQTPEFQHLWRQQYIVPFQYIGGTITGKKVNFLKVYFASNSRWGFFPSDGVAINFWDPDLMHDWVTAASDDVQNDATRTFSWPAAYASHQNSDGIIFDATNVPTPTGPIFNK